MRKPRHQLFATYVSWTLTGFLALGAFLDGVGNAVGLITFNITLLGTIAIVVYLTLLQLYLDRYPLAWVCNDKAVKITKLNLGLLLPFLGMIVLLWIPVALNVLTMHKNPEDSVPQAVPVNITDNLQVSSVKTIQDSRAEIHVSGRQKIVSVYWEVLLSNLGESNLSIVHCRILQVGAEFPEAWYTNMEQGLYSFENGEPSKEVLPFDIPPGGTKKSYVRVGIMMTPDASRMVEDALKGTSASTVSLRTIWRLLNAKGTDFYGNKLAAVIGDDTGKMIATFPSVNDLREQEFEVSFTTARGHSIKEPLSWYKYGGPYDLSRYKTN